MIISYLTGPLFFIAWLRALSGLDGPDPHLWQRGYSFFFSFFLQGPLIIVLSCDLLKRVPFLVTWPDCHWVPALYVQNKAIVTLLCLIRSLSPCTVINPILFTHLQSESGSLCHKESTYLFCHFLCSKCIRFHDKHSSTWNFLQLLHFWIHWLHIYLIHSITIECN